MYIYLVPVNLFIQVHEMFDLDPASWAALVAQLVRASVRSAECRGFESHLRQLIFSFFICLRCLSFFLSFFLSFHLTLSCTCINSHVLTLPIVSIIVHVHVHVHVLTLPIVSIIVYVHVRVLII